MLGSDVFLIITGIVVAACKPLGCSSLIWTTWSPEAEAQHVAVSANPATQESAIFSKTLLLR
jgi:hypothetical protein